jgi:predicted tellurium resistance membrane protein TerC
LSTPPAAAIPYGSRPRAGASRGRRRRRRGARARRRADGKVFDAPSRFRHRGNVFVILAVFAGLVATPLLAALVAVEAADLAFAADSAPAVFSVTRDPFVAFSSNVFAILGLRSLYFALEGAARKLHYLRHALAAILLFVGGKMLLADVPVGPSLAALGLTLAAAVCASIARDRRIARAEARRHAPAGAAGPVRP